MFDSLEERQIFCSCSLAGKRKILMGIFGHITGSGLTGEDKKELLRSYGLNPDEFISKPSSKGLGGKAKRKKLICPKSMNVRLMMKFVKGAAFDILQIAGGCPVSLRLGYWLDLYSRTGSIGIEATSRGCSKVHLLTYYMYLDSSKYGL
ncbi:hypothetical protein Ddye_014353 [Dipteronia dyeriana]|uniref:Uncharacterized protein n=1 Tax=Dipteronia dyeriana TaxID=168575 RepID=A0AAD9X845_9ROSI|nr:hypothetical protein Ddye_014353 [Dipteronia dyeriana]